LTSYLENFGEKHPDVARCRSNLSAILMDLNDLNGAKEQLELASPIFEETLGKNHPYVATVKNNLAYVLEELGDQAAAIRLWQEALAVWRAVLGEAHPSTQGVLRALRQRGLEPGEGE
jgi:tetratricopeptide (TPR) repeat protein